MKTFQELIEDLRNNLALAEAIKKALAAKTQTGGEEDPFAAFAAAAAAQGYAVSPEEVRELAAAQGENMSEEELTKVAGGDMNSIVTCPALIST